ncbi:hypothetical protein OF83DRAFT_1086937 [Amylostereum chailletii]|nr:hypothetical protein OF83DRAFT_1086937 [Amylostereum chailletii]
MAIPFDLLMLIQQFLQHNPAMLAMMRTCRTLYAAGVRLLIQSGVSIWKRSSVASFCRFMLSEAPRSFSYLRQLSLPVSVFELETRDLLLNVLRRLDHVDTLHLSSGVVSEDPELGGAVAALDTVKSLKISLPRGDRASSATFISKIRSPVATLDLSFVGSGRFVDPLPILAPLCATLQDIHFSGVSMRSVGVAYPLATSLYVDTDVMSDVLPLVVSFPHLRRLTVIVSQGIHAEDTRVDAIRRDNQLAQDDDRWHRLEYLYADVLTLYLLGLTCKVTSMNVSSLRCSPLEVARLHRVLDDAQPSRLGIRTIHDGFDSHQIARMIPPTTPLTHLRLEIDLTHVGQHVRVPAILDDLYRLIRPFSLDCLLLKLVCSDPRGGNVRTPDDDPVLSNAGFVRQLDVAAIARKLARLVPSLRYVFLNISNTRLGPSMRCWEVVGKADEDGERTLVDMSDFAAWEIVRAEGL